MSEDIQKILDGLKQLASSSGLLHRLRDRLVLLGEAARTAFLQEIRARVEAAI